MNRYISMLLLLLAIQTSLRSQNSDWTQANPNPQNDFYAIKFFNQNTGYVVGSGGVILKNTTGSNNWTSIPSGTVNDLYGMYFFDVAHGYIVGAGGLIMYSSDGGNSWTHLVTSNGYNLRSITFINQNTGFICGDHGELYRTTIGLYGWTLFSVTTKRLNTVAIGDSLHIYACGDSSVFIRSTNGGLNWISQTIGTNYNHYGVCFVSALTGYLTANGSGPLKTTDGGVSWGTFNYGYNWNAVSMKFLNQNTGYAVTRSGPLLKTSDSGANWMTWFSSQLLPGNTIYDISLADSNKVYACGIRGIILKSIDTGITGTSFNIGGCRNSLSSISFINANSGEVKSDNQYMYTTNGGASWIIYLDGTNSWFEGSGAISKVRLIPPSSGYRVGTFYGMGFHNDYIQNSTDGGLTWNGNRYYNIQNGSGFAGFCEAGGVTYLATYNQVLKNSGTGWTSVLSVNNVWGLSFANASTGMVGGGGVVQGITRTTNGGLNWTFIPTGNLHRITQLLLLPSGTGFIAGDSSYMMRTLDFGSNWTLLSENGIQTILDINFVTDNIGWYLGQSRTSPYTKRLFYTNNGGTNFQQLQSLMNFNVNGFSFIDANSGYVCGDSGVVLKTTNGGLTFVNPALENLPKEYLLSQNYPNPFNPTTTIKFDIPPSKGVRGMTSVKLTIYDVTGRVVATLINQQMQPGSYSINWDASNYPSGFYFYKLIKDSYNQSRRMVLIK